MTAETSTYYTAAELRAACERVIAARAGDGTVTYPEIASGVGYDQSLWSAYEAPCGTACCLHGHVRLQRPVFGRAGARRLPLADDYADAHVAVRAALFSTDATPEIVLALLDLPLCATEDDVVCVLEGCGVDEDDYAFITIMDILEAMEKRP